MRELLAHIDHFSQLVLGPDEKRGKALEEGMDGIKGIDLPYRSKKFFPQRLEAWSRVRGAAVEKALKVIDGDDKADDCLGPLPGPGYLFRDCWGEGQIAVNEVRRHERQNLQRVFSSHVALDVEPNENEEAYFGWSEVSRHGDSQGPALCQHHEFWLFGFSVGRRPVINI